MPDSNESLLIFNEELIELNLEASTDKEALSKLGGCFIEQDYAKASFSEALVAREEAYPTGLLTKTVGIAIPHTDPVHVKEGSLGVGVLKDPVIFRTMDTGEEIEVSILFMLAITRPSAQLRMLQKVIEIIKGDQILLHLKQAKRKTEVMRLLEPFLADSVKRCSNG